MNITREEILSLCGATEKGQGEYASPCPYCTPGTWTGNDRFVFFSSTPTAYCRRCGVRVSYQQLVDYLRPEEGLKVDPSLEFTEVPKRPIEPTKVLVANEEYVNTLHASVDRSYWYKFGWDDTTIDRFKLGYGTLYPGSRKSPRHVIPFVPRAWDGTVVSGYAFEGRTLDQSEPKNIKTGGLTGKHWFALVEDDPDSNVLAISEGVKDGVSAWHIGYKNVWFEFGSTQWGEQKADFLQTLPYTTVIVFGDNDDAGLKFIQDVRKTLPQVTVKALRYPKTAPNKADLTDLLVLYKDSTKSYIEANLYVVEAEVNRGYIPDYTLFDSEYEPAYYTSNQSLSALRRELKEQLDDYIDNYREHKRKARRPIVKVLAAPPGVGKSYVLVKKAEELARKHLARKQVTQKQLHEEAVTLQNMIHNATSEDERKLLLRQLESLQKKIKREQQVTSVLYAGPFRNGWQDIIDQGADLDLWYDYQPRSPSNCADYDKVTRLSEKGYVARAYCDSVCPFASDCRIKGYLKQEEERRSKPITYVRHQNLTTDMVSDYQTVFVDENPVAVFEEPYEVTLNDLKPVTERWSESLPPAQVAKLEKFVAVLRSVVADFEGSGVELIRELDNRAGDLTALMTVDPDVLKSVQPATVITEVEDYDQLPHRSIAVAYEYIKEELALYKQAPDKLFNSKLHVKDKKLKVYPLRVWKLSGSKPLVIADGTAFPELYGLLTNRKVSTYRPELKSPLASTTVLWGSDFTRKTLKTQTKGLIKDFQKYLESRTSTVRDILGEEFSLDDLDIDENLYNSTLLSSAIETVKLILERHSSVLVVTYKDVRFLLENRLSQIYPQLMERVRWGHYGALRGTNRYKDCEAVLLIGSYRIPYSFLWERVQAWGALRDPWDYVPFDVALRPKPYHGRIDGYTYYTFTHPFGDAFINMVEEGEVQQCLDRIRIHTSGEKKYAYLALSRPSAKWVDDTKLLFSELKVRREEVRTALQQRVLTEINTWGRLVTSKRQLRKEFKVSQKVLEKEIKNVVTGTGQAD